MKRLLALLLLIPLAVGAFFATDLASTWSKEEQGAPVPMVSGADLVPARRAAGEASTQADFVKRGTKELLDGSTKLSDGMGELSSGASTASGAAAQLSQGMTQLQAGTAQLADGATRVADGVEEAVGYVNQIGIIQQQLLAMIDQTDADLAKNPLPDAKQARARLAEVRPQVENFQFDAAIVDQLAALRSGSREVANQLGKNGSQYHDGIYTATQGAQQLAQGLGQLESGVSEAKKGADDLKAGAERVDGMAQKSTDNIKGTARAIPVLPVVNEEAADEQETFLPPLYAFLVSLVVLLAAAFVGLTRLPLWWKVGSNVAIVALGIILLWLLSTAVSPLALVGIALVLALTAAVGTLSATLLTRYFGQIGYGIVLAGALVQAGITGWVWESLTSGGAARWAQALAGIMPLNYPTAAITALGNGGNQVILWTGIAVLAALAAISGGLLVTTREEQLA